MISNLCDFHTDRLCGPFRCYCMWFIRSPFGAPCGPSRVKPKRFECHYVTTLRTSRWRYCRSSRCDRCESERHHRHSRRPCRGAWHHDLVLERNAPHAEPDNIPSDHIYVLWYYDIAIASVAMYNVVRCEYFVEWWWLITLITDESVVHWSQTRYDTRGTHPHMYLRLAEIPIAWFVMRTW